MLIYWKMITKTRVVSSRLDVIEISFIRSGFPIESDFLCAKFARFVFRDWGSESTTSPHKANLPNLPNHRGQWQWAQSDANNDDDTRKFASKSGDIGRQFKFIHAPAVIKATCWAGTEPHFVIPGICWITTHDALGLQLIHNVRKGFVNTNSCKSQKF